MRVLHRQSRYVLRPDNLRLMQRLRVNLLRLDRHIRPSVHEHLFDPRVPDVTGVRCRPDYRRYTENLFRTQTCFDKVIHDLLEGGQLVEVQELYLDTGVVEPV